MSILDSLRRYRLTKATKRVILLATEALYAEQFGIEACVNKIAGDPEPSNLLRAYIVIQIAASLTEPVSHPDVERVLRDLSSVELFLNKPEFEVILESHKDSAEIAWLERQQSILEGKLAWRTNEYSYEGMIYKMENTKRGPTSTQEREKFRRMASEISEAERKLEEHLSEKESLAGVEAAIARMREEIEEEERINGPRSKEELDQEYQDLINQLKEAAKEARN